jgi:hypothetical protein
VEKYLCELFVVKERFFIQAVAENHRCFYTQDGSIRDAVLTTALLDTGTRITSIHSLKYPHTVLRVLYRSLTMGSTGLVAHLHLCPNDDHVSAATHLVGSATFDSSAGL